MPCSIMYHDGCQRVSIIPIAMVVLLFWLHGHNNIFELFGSPLEEATFANGDPRPTPYPPSFRIHFDTNISRPETATVHRPLRSALYYDWAIPAQRIDHPPGAYECVRFYNVTTHGCQLYFRKEGMYRVISGTDDDKSTFRSCCLDIPDLGPPPPDWAQQANPRVGGFKHDDYSEYAAYEFVFDKPSQSRLSRGLLQIGLQFFGTSFGVRGENLHLGEEDIYDEYHTAREVHDGNPLRNGIPLLFTFPSKAIGRQDFHFDPVSLIVGSQDPTFFQLPEGCENVACDKDGPPY